MKFLDRLQVVQTVRKHVGDWYVYVLARAGVPFYVGAGHAYARGSQRLSAHEAEAKRHRHRCHKCHTIRAMLRDGEVIGYAIASWHRSERAAFDAERRLIKTFGRRDNGTGTLTNLTDGGDLGSGASTAGCRRLSRFRKRRGWTKVEKARAVAARLASPVWRAAVIAANKRRIGTKLTAGHRRRIGVALRGKVQSEETREKRRQKMLGRIITRAWRKKLSLALRGRKHSAAMKLKIRNGLLRWQAARRAAKLLPLRCSTLLAQE